MPRAGSRFRRCVVVVLLIVALALGYFWFTAPTDPIYGAKRLSEHVVTYYADAHAGWRPGQSIPASELLARQRSWEESGEALKNLDEKALPLLRSWLKRPVPSWRRSAARFVESLGYAPRALTFDYQSMACLAAQQNPALGVSLLPDLVPCFSSESARVRATSFSAFHNILESPAARALVAGTGRHSVSNLMQEIRNGTPETAFYSSGLLWALCKEDAIAQPERLVPDLVELGRLRQHERFETEHFLHGVQIGPARFRAHNYSGGAYTATAYLKQCVNLIDPDWRHRHLAALERGPEADGVGAAWALGKARMEAEKAIPLLIANLSSSNRALVENCATALGNYGRPAEPALPHLTNLLGHSKLAIRIAATNAIRQIRFEPGSSAMAPR